MTSLPRRSRWGQLFTSAPNNAPTSIPKPRRKSSLSINQVGLLVVGVTACLALFFQSPTSYLNRLEEEEFAQEWVRFRKDYQQRFQREPPPGMDSWLKFAKQHECEVYNFYNVIERDLDYFRANNQAAGKKLGYDGLFDEGMSHTDHFLAYELNNHKLKAVKMSGGHWRKISRFVVDPIMQSMLKPLKQHTPPLKLKLFFNLHDRPDLKTAHAKYPAFSINKMGYITENQPPPTKEELMKLFPTGIHVFQHNHDNLPEIPIVENHTHGFDTCRHLLAPYHFNYGTKYTPGWYWPFYSKGPDFFKRKNVINWRGRTTGKWLKGPRFHLLKDYGGTGVHPLQNNRTKTNVDVDFAFLEVVQNPRGQTLPPGFRIDKKYQYYRQMQQYKYIMDVDGNGFTARFPGLLRSGSVVFKSTQFREWFHGVFQPYQDYIPVNFDLSDLVEKVAWADANPDIMEKIAEHSREQSFKYHRQVDMQCYMYRIVLEYATLFENNDQAV